MSTVPTGSNHQIVITRLINAPRELVFKTFTESQQMAIWWGPHTFSNPSVELDVRVGGSWRIVMKGPDGYEFPVGGTYLEVEEPGRLVYTADHLQDFKGETPPPTAIHDLTFEDRDGKTFMTAVFRFETKEDLEAMVGYQFSAGWNQGMERLEALLGNVK
ncbi:polyketide cyclase [bacterium]|nr:MAG: polyketide cyclase [bacterium]